MRRRRDERGGEGGSTWSYSLRFSGLDSTWAGVEEGEDIEEKIFQEDFWLPMAASEQG